MTRVEEMRVKALELAMDTVAGHPMVEGGDIVALADRYLAFLRPDIERCPFIDDAGQRCERHAGHDNDPSKVGAAHLTRRQP